MAAHAVRSLSHRRTRSRAARTTTLRAPRPARAARPATLEAPPTPARPSLRELIGIARDALAMPPFYLSSLFGPPWTWLPPHWRDSEFQALDLWRPLRTLRTIADVTVPSIPMMPPPFLPPRLAAMFWKPTVVLQHGDHNGSLTTFPHEAWIFINGVATNDVVVQINATCIARLFHRPLTVVHNSTNSLAVDLLQSALGKEWERLTEPGRVALPVICDALSDPGKKRVVVIAHSQGTIIMASVLAWLKAIVHLTRGERVMMVPRGAPAPVLPPGEAAFVCSDPWPMQLQDFMPLTLRQLAKLEIYAFATCANEMTYFHPFRGAHVQVPWMEHFANGYDLVARLGLTAPHPEKWPIHIDGPRYVRRDAWGHLLDEHYLRGIEERQKAGHHRGARGGPAPFERVDGGDPQATPRLFESIGGGVPAS